VGGEPFLPKVSFHGMVQEVGFQVPVERGSVLVGDPLQPFHGLPEVVRFRPGGKHTLCDGQSLSKPATWTELKNAPAQFRALDLESDEVGAIVERGERKI